MFQMRMQLHFWQWTLLAMVAWGCLIACDPFLAIAQQRLATTARRASSVAGPAGLRVSQGAAPGALSGGASTDPAKRVRKEEDHRVPTSEQPGLRLVDKTKVQKFGAFRPFRISETGASPVRGEAGRPQ